MDQLGKLNEHLDELMEMDITVYAISPSSVEDHQYIKEAYGFEFEILSDQSLQFGEEFGFVNLNKQEVYRGYVAVNLDAETLKKEVDYLVGDNIGEVMSVLEEL